MKQNEDAIKIVQLMSRVFNGEIEIMEDIRVEWREVGKLNEYKDILDVVGGKHCCWVHEYGGYFSYCHKDGRLIIRTGHGADTNRTWSTVGYDILSRSGIGGIKL